MYAGIQDFPQSHARHFDPRSVDQRQNHSEKEISEIAISLREVKKKLYFHAYKTNSHYKLGGFRLFDFFIHTNMHIIFFFLIWNRYPPTYRPLTFWKTKSQWKKNQDLVINYVLNAFHLSYPIFWRVLLVHPAIQMTLLMIHSLFLVTMLHIFNHAQLNNLTTRLGMSSGKADWLHPIFIECARLLMQTTVHSHFLRLF